AETCAAWICLADTRMQVFQRVIHVCKTVMAPRDCPITVFPRQIFETFEHISHPGLADRVQTVWIGRRGRETDGGKTNLLCEVFVNPENVMDTRAQRDTRADGIRLVPPQHP